MAFKKKKEEEAPSSDVTETVDATSEASVQGEPPQEKGVPNTKARGRKKPTDKASVTIVKKPTKMVGSPDTSGICGYKAPGTGKFDKTREVFSQLFSSKDNPTVVLDPAKLKQPWPVFPSGSIVLDYQIGGKPNNHGVKPCNGLPRGRLINIYGAEGSGKTTVALSMAKAVCQIGGRVGFLDWENAISPAYAKEMGLPVDDADVFDLKQPNTLEDGFKILWTWATFGIDLIILDSIGAAVPEVIFGQKVAEVGHKGQIGLAAGKWSYFLPKLQRRVRTSGSVIVAISQTRKNIGGYGEVDQAQGGEAWKFFSSLRIKLQRGKIETVKVYNPILNKDEDRPVGLSVTAKLVKCKMADSQGTEAPFYIRFGEGIDNIRSLIEIGRAHGLITGTSYLEWPQQDGTLVRGRGMEQFREMIIDQGLENDLHAQILPLLGTRPKTKSLTATSSVEPDDADLAGFDFDGEAPPTPEPEV